MPDEFAKLYKDVSDATKFLRTVEQCRPHYQRLLEYIQTHPGERDGIAALLVQSFDIYLLQFLMASLKWPEVQSAAEKCWNNGGNHFYDSEIKDLLQIYRVA